jgi:Rrf2 family nitric oxide-sensitive transcriptional repressor
MRLTAHTDYALRIMLHAAMTSETPDQLSGITQVADAHGISRNNAMKVVNELAKAGLLETVRGRHGGFRLARPAASIRLGEIVRLTEPCLNLADCDHCILRGQCGLTAMLKRALNAFLTELDQQTLAEAAEKTRLPTSFLLP